MKYSFTVGKLYRYDGTNDIVALNEKQFHINLISYMIRIEKFYSLNAKNIRGNVDMLILKPESILLLIDIIEKPLAGIYYTILKCIFEDKIIYIPLSTKNNMQECLTCLETV